MTDRIEAIRARHAARLRTRALPPDWALVNEDMAVLLAEVDAVELNLRQRELHHFETEQENAELKAEAERYKTAFEKANEACTIREAEIERPRAALAPVALDAEPTEWEWSLDDVVQGDGHVWHRVGDGTYPWASWSGSDQRDQDITELVTKHGGRVLVCKARGIGVESGGAS